MKSLLSVLAITNFMMALLLFVLGEHVQAAVGLGVAIYMKLSQMEAEKR